MFHIRFSFCDIECDYESNDDKHNEEGSEPRFILKEMEYCGVIFFLDLLKTC